MSSAQFMPHGMCYLWQPGILIANVVADALIAFAYLCIAAALVWIVRKRADLPFTFVFFMFALFIVSCGATHAMSIFVIWHPAYWVDAGIKWVTAGSSVATALLLIPVAPKLLAIRSPREFEMLNEELLRGMAERDAELKARLEERTLERDAVARDKALAELMRTNAAEEQLRLHTSELEVLVSELESFSYSVSHDLRAPVRAVLGYTHVLVEEYTDSLDEEGQRLLSVVQDEAARMGELIDGLLAFSGLSRQQMNTVLVDMNALAHEVVGELGTSDGKDAPPIEIGPLPEARGDRVLMRQVWHNLISNAVKYSGKTRHPAIEIWATSENGSNMYHVRDNGVGFDMAYAGKLFGVFHRLHRDEEFPGTGVGLAIVKRIVERHGGTVWADAKLGDGATFTFALPQEHSDSVS